MIPVYKPYLPPTSLKCAHDALDSTWLSHGKYLQLVREKLQELLKVSYVLPLNNGTSACHLMAKSLYRRCQAVGMKKIIVPNNVYVAAWNAFLFDYNYDLIPIDADLDTWNFDLQKLDSAISEHPDADVLIVHNLGNIIHVPNLKRRYPNINFVEDNCEGLFGSYENVFSGTAGFTSAISFFGNKNITSGEGGALITNNEEVYNFAKCLHGQGQSSIRFIHSELGYNYRMTNVQAAILCGQLDILPEIISRKHHIFNMYRQAFGNRDDVKIQEQIPGTEPANWMFGIRVPNSPGYEQAEAYLKMQGIEIRPMFYSIFTHDHMKNNLRISNVDCTNADLLQKECIILPSFPELNIGEQNHIIYTVNEYIKTLGMS